MLENIKTATYIQNNTVMGFSFSVKFDLDLKYFEKLIYFPLFYACKTQIEYLLPFFLIFLKIQTINSIMIHVKFHVLLPWIFF